MLLQGFQRWAGQVTADKHLEYLLLKGISRMQNRRLAAAFVAWGENSSRRRRNRIVVQRSIWRLKNQLAAMTYNAWCEYIETRKTNHVRIARALGKLKHRIAAAAFEKWTETLDKHCKKRILLRDVVTRTLRKIIHVKTHAAFTRWVVNVVAMRTPKLSGDMCLTCGRPAGGIFAPVKIGGGWDLKPVDRRDRVIISVLAPRSRRPPSNSANARRERGWTPASTKLAVASSKVPDPVLTGDSYAPRKSPKMLAQKANLTVGVDCRKHGVQLPVSPPNSSVPETTAAVVKDRIDGLYGTNERRWRDTDLNAGLPEYDALHDPHCGYIPPPLRKKHSKLAVQPQRDVHAYGRTGQQPGFSANCRLTEPCITTAHYSRRSAPLAMYSERESVPALKILEVERQREAKADRSEGRRQQRPSSALSSYQYAQTVQVPMGSHGIHARGSGTHAVKALRRPQTAPEGKISTPLRGNNDVKYGRNSVRMDRTPMMSSCQPKILAAEGYATRPLLSAEAIDNLEGMFEEIDTLQHTAKLYEDF